MSDDVARFAELSGDFCGELTQLATSIYRYVRAARHLAQQGEIDFEEAVQAVLSYTVSVWALAYENGADEVFYENFKNFLVDFDLDEDFIGFPLTMVFMPVARKELMERDPQLYPWRVKNREHLFDLIFETIDASVNTVSGISADAFSLLRRVVLMLEPGHYTLNTAWFLCYMSETTPLFTRALLLARQSLGRASCLDEFMWMLADHYIVLAREKDKADGRTYVAEI
ncbi:MAG: hypothetical protein DRO09_00485 [Thermoprotei archaeon]|nr:MAG: hypothetical protein DRO09_00485 [Thermoprotei archaeon]